MNIRGRQKKATAQLIWTVQFLCRIGIVGLQMLQVYVGECTSAIIRILDHTRQVV
jgi:hypothetical protein